MQCSPHDGLFGPCLRHRFGWLALWILLAALSLLPQAASANNEFGTVRQAFARQVPHRLELPAAQAQRYAGLLSSALQAVGHDADAGDWVVLVDRNPRVQAAMLFARSDGDAPWRWVGSAPTSTGKPGTFDHFITPLGVFDHSLENMDFRAEGTVNENGIRGYGARGMRVYDFGWVDAERGWGKGGESQMRLQMHATDPEHLEARLGHPASKGCVRIPAALNRLIDRFGLIDADYLDAVERGDALWVLAPDRTPVSRPGRYLVIVDSGARDPSVPASAVRGE
ncbi:L,D-transpeptidase [Cupriavidus sp. 2TAF22]|uniref:L,D-transpeptidase n=1 Tax=unclassified Cupriavidus TaxID=2640874 RepID=UPI003F90DF8B